jgi:hypothetical protein
MLLDKEWVDVLCRIVDFVDFMLCNGVDFDTLTGFWCICRAARSFRGDPETWGCAICATLLVALC